MVNRVMTLFSANRPSLFYLFIQTFKLSATSWGGFSLMGACRAVFVEQNRFVTEGDYADAVALAWLMPGPVANNVVIKLGALMRGTPGAIVTGAGAVLPFFLAMCMMALSFRLLSVHQHEIQAIVGGLIPSTCAVILASACNQARSLLKSWRDGVIAAGALCGFLVFKGGLAPLCIMLGAALAGLAIYPRSSDGETLVVTPSGTRRPGGIWIVVLLLSAVLSFHFVPDMLSASRSNLTIFGTFAGVSLTLFGGGLIVIPILNDMLVQSLGWLDQTAFYTAIASAQIVPGPLLSSVSFMGYHIGGWSGAAAATAGMFVPPGMLMLAAASGVAHLRRFAWFAPCICGTRVAVVGLTIAAGLSMGAGATPHWASALIFVIAFLMLSRFKMPASIVVPAAGLAGFLVFGSTSLITHMETYITISG